MKTRFNFLTILTIAGAIAFFTACGGGESSENSSSESTEAAEHGGSDEVSSEAVDPNAKSDSKGVGKFTSVEVGPDIDADMAAKGKAVFETKCTACHKTSSEKLVGPGLKDITNLRTPEWIMNMITNPEEMTKKDPVAKALFEEHLIQMTFQNVSDDEARQILEYLRQNDKS